MTTLNLDDKRRRSLNLSDQELATAGSLTCGLLRHFERSLGERPVMPTLNRGQLRELFDTPFPELGVGVERLFHDIKEKILPNCTTVAHPRFLAYVLGPPNGISPFAEAIAAALNQNCNFWQLSPAASVIEQKVVSWLASLFAYPATAGGIITSGGSMANLMALSTAMHDKAPVDLRTAGLSAVPAPLVVYTSTEAHRSIEKAAAILGLGLNNVRKVPVDSDFRLRIDLLERAIENDRKSSLIPFCVVAAAGTVNTGAIDPLDEIAELCQRENLWLHVDGAYGALFILSNRIKDQLFSCGRADSISLDPHKLLFAPLEAGCLIVRHQQKLRKAFHFASSYLTAEDDPALVNFLEYGPQLSRGFKAFKIWCSLQTFGIQAFRTAAEHMLDISEYMAQRITAEPSLELLAPVRLSAVCFGFKGSTSNTAILAKLVDEGTALLGPVHIAGRIGIRACITNYRTTRSDIDLILDRLLQLGECS
ncbi:MAG: aminotransferase class V-fold PLP-dependent enzyme [Acidobacteria bacterium]|nr:aminotransferase class V-fold PLP-dependent enzyme [Acidobacteriota bacterium]